MHRPIVIPNRRSQRARRIHTASGRRSHRNRQHRHRESKLQRHRILILRIPRIPAGTAQHNQHQGGQELQRHRLHGAQPIVGHRHAVGGRRRQRVRPEDERRRQHDQQAVAHERADDLGHRVHDGQRPADRAVEQGAYGHGRIEVGAGHAAEALDDQHDGETEAEGADVVAARRRPAEAAAAADKQQHRGADQFGEELGDHVGGADAEACRVNSWGIVQSDRWYLTYSRYVPVIKWIYQVDSLG